MPTQRIRQRASKAACRRKKWIDQYDADRISKKEFEEKMDAVEKAAREVEAQSPAAPPTMPDAGPIVAGLVRTLARFRTWPFAEQRAMLKRIVRSFQVIDGAIPEITLSSAFLGNWQTPILHNARSGGEVRQPAVWRRQRRVPAVHGARFRRVLGQREMRPRFVIIRQEGNSALVLESAIVG
jgi:hypothetical protein